MATDVAAQAIATGADSFMSNGSIRATLNSFSSTTRRTPEPVNLIFPIHDVNLAAAVWDAMNNFTLSLKTFLPVILNRRSGLSWSLVIKSDSWGQKSLEGFPLIFETIITAVFLDSGEGGWRDGGGACCCCCC